jgi:L-ascorbate metabolism protein UlaG (beta-lactamase superfamily)
VSTIDATIAAEVVRQLEPKLVIPMHYKTPEVVRKLEPVEGFLKEIGVKEATLQPKLSVSRSNLPDSTNVILLSH